MGVIKCEAELGWAGFAAVVGGAQPGDTVRLPAGKFVGAETIVVPSGVTLEGSGDLETELIYRTEPESAGPALTIDHAEKVTISNLRVVADVGEVPPRALPGGDIVPNDPEADDFQPIEWGLVWTNDSQDVSVKHLHLQSLCQQGSLKGLVFRRSSKVDATDNIIKGFGSTGLSLLLVSNSEIGGNKVSGCDSGITLFSSKASLTENECWGNERGGIALMQKPDTPDAPPSTGTLTANYCHHNKFGGIILYSSDATLTGNECRENTLGGIALLRQSNISDAPPSTGTLTGNCCYHNGQSGIGLFSSDAVLTENDCWENTLHGIALQEQSNLSDTPPSTGTLTANRCYQNEVCGIALFSSKTKLTENECWANEMPGILIRDGEATLSRNECWENGHTGILFESDKDDKDDKDDLDPRSVGILVGNLCHHNQLSGIGVHSSNATLTKNVCWGNRNIGIVLQSTSKAKSHQSQGVLKDNRCYDNTNGGISIASSDATLVGNECWENSYGIRFFRHEENQDVPATGSLSGNLCYTNEVLGYALMDSVCLKVAVNHGWENESSYLSHQQTRQDTYNAVLLNDISPEELGHPAPDNWLAKRRAEQKNGALAEYLENNTYDRPDQLADFIGGPGCSDCLDAYLNDDKASESEFLVEETPQTGWNEFEFEEDTETLPIKETSAASNRSQSPRQHVFRRLRQHINNPAADAQALCVISDDGAWIEDVVEGFNSLHIDGENSPFPEVKNIAPSLRSANKIAGPFVVEHGLRSSNALNEEANAYPFLEEALVEGRSLHMERLKTVLSNPRFYFGAATLPAFLLLFVPFSHATGFDGPWADVAGALYFIIKEAGESFQILTLLELGTITSYLAWIAGRFNSLLPRRLHLPTTKLGGRVKRLFSLQQHTPEVNQTAGGDDITTDANWRRFVKRHLFGGGNTTASVLLIKDVSYWSPADKKALAEVLKMRRPEQKLLILFDIQDRGLAKTIHKRFLSDLDVHTTGLIDLDGRNNEFGKLVPAVAESETVQDVATIHALLGTKDQDAQTKNNILQALTSGYFEALDLIPMLTFGSTPEAPFTLTRAASTSIENFAPQLEQALKPYVRHFTAHNEIAFNATANAQELKAVFGYLSNAKVANESTLPSGEDSNGVKTKEIHNAGRAGLKTSLLAELNRVFEEDGESADHYVALGLGCGEIHNLRAAQKIMESTGKLPSALPKERLEAFTDRMRAALRLAKERQSISPTPLDNLKHQRAQLKHRWAKLLQIVCDINVHNADRSEAAEAYILVLSGYDLIRLQSGHTSTAGELFDEIEQPSSRSDMTLKSAFISELRETYGQFENCDGGYVLRMIKRRLGDSWEHLPPALAQRISQEAEIRAKQAPKLDQLFVEAKDASSWAALLERHSYENAQFMKTAFCLLARSIINSAPDEPIVTNFADVLHRYRHHPAHEKSTSETKSKFAVTSQFEDAATCAAFCEFLDAQVPD